MPPTSSSHAGARRPRNRALPCLRPWNPPCSLDAAAAARNLTDRSGWYKGRNRENGGNVEGANIQEIAAFLSRFPPFTDLDPDELEAVAAAAQVVRYSAGEDAL